MPETIKLSPAEIEKQFITLNQSTKDKWQLVNGKLHKQFVFKDFIHAMAFMKKASEQAETMNHHPEWCNVYNQVTIDLITHSIGGLSSLDFKLAIKLEQLS